MRNHTERALTWLTRRLHILAGLLTVAILCTIPSASTASSRGSISALPEVPSFHLSGLEITISELDSTPEQVQSLDDAEELPTKASPVDSIAAQSVTDTITDTVTNVDIALVFDQSDSMNDDIYCYRDNDKHSCYVRGTGEYPEGERLYLPFADWICEPQVPITYAGYEILVAEAEYFSYTTSYAEHPYDRDLYTFPSTFWMLQRVAHSQASGYRYEEDDRRGAHLMHMPHRSSIDGHESATSDSPRLDYGFTIPSSAPLSDTWFVWIRAQCGAYRGSDTRVDSCIVHWGLDGNQRVGESSNYDDFGRQNTSWPRELGSDYYYWKWVRLGSATLGRGDTVLVNIWGGGSGLRLDKVLLSRNPAPEDGSWDSAPVFVQGTTPNWTAVRTAEYQTYERDNYYGGPTDTRGHVGYACSPCNPIYGLAVNQGCTVGQPPGPGCEDLDGSGLVEADEVCDNRYDDIFDDEQPMRAAKEAAKDFARQMHARYQQLGLVLFDTTASVERELNCIQQRGYPPEAYGPGVWDLDAGPDPAWTWCYDHRASPDGYTGDPATGVISGSILYAIEQAYAGGHTSIAGGLARGIEVLSAEPGHYGRPCAVSAIVLLSDGIPNRSPDYAVGCGVGSCCEHDLYQPNDGTDDENNARDCAVYYANLARQESILIYSIGLGVNADHALLQTLADRTAGAYYYAPTTRDLTAILEDIAERSRSLAPCLEQNEDVASPTVQPGKPLTFTLALTNTGDVDLHATITDTLPEHVTPTGVITWTPTITTPGGVWAKTLVVTPDLGYAGPLTNVFEVTTRECFATEKVTSLIRDLEAAQDSAPTSVRPGKPLTYTLAVTNTGNVDLHATITNTLPEHVTPSGTLTWTVDITQPDGVWTETVVVTVEMGYAGPLTNVLEVTTLEGVTETSTVVLVRQLQAAQQAAPSPRPTEMVLTYTLAVTNTGNVDLTADITDVLPSQVSPAGPLTWTQVLIHPGEVWTQLIAVEVEPGYCGPLTNTVLVSTQEGAVGTSTETITFGRWWIHLPLIVRLFR